LGTRFLLCLCGTRRRYPLVGYVSAGCGDGFPLRDASGARYGLAILRQAALPRQTCRRCQPNSFPIRSSPSTILVWSTV
jgi:hypothetical protein